MTKIIVMLIWIGTYQGGPATIHGFQTIDACERARPFVDHAARRGMTTIFVYTTCMELDGR